MRKKINKKNVKATLQYRNRNVVVSGYSWLNQEEVVERFRYESFNKIYKKNLRKVDEMRGGNTHYLYPLEEEAERLTVQQLSSINIDQCYDCVIVN